ncbi:MAG: saccharopine dehydrogenase NADP-binding domain-containing protein [Bacteroidetes bacterium]|nr:saccharopine dehydrogenase NADP-binding domain-containing protein [Bacteroidota bacterium]
MKRILVIGAGRSTVSLIEYLLQQAAKNNWHLTVADMDLRLAESKTKGHAQAQAISLDITNPEQRKKEINKADFVVSMLPAFMHTEIVKDCVAAGKHVATASYVSPEMLSLDDEAKKKNILLLNECGLDPGIDHASAMKIIDEIQKQGGEITSFKSYCGGLVAPESNDNPWGYKFSWNPRNVVVAGQATAQYLDKGQTKYIPYNRIFTQIDVIDVEGIKYDAYANRDSLNYIDAYKLQGAQTVLRGTLRQVGYCRAWNILVKLGLTDDSFVIKNTQNKTYTQLLQSFLPDKHHSVKQNLLAFIGSEADASSIEKIDWLGFFNDEKIEMEQGTPAQLLQHLLEKKWKLQEHDKDLVVMQHLFEINNSKNPSLPKKITSSLVVTGSDQHHTAMAKTVGLPLAITIKNFLTGKIDLNGVQIPTCKKIYEPLLQELETHQIIFKEHFFS